MKKVAIVSSGYFPVPDVLGGAVEGLITSIARENGHSGDIDLKVFSMDDFDARREAQSFGTATRFEFIAIPKYVKMADKVIYWFAKNVLRKEKNLSWAHILQRIFYLRSVGRSLAHEEEDVLVLENHPTQFMVLKTRGNEERYKGKVVFHLHNEVSSDFGQRELLSQVSAVACVSGFIAQSFAHFMGWQDDDKRLSVLKNCATEAFFDRGRSIETRKDTRRRYGIADDEFVVLFSGRLTAEKGAAELLEAFARADVSNSRLLVAGAYYFKDSVKSPYEEELKRKALLLGNRVLFTGYVDHSEMADLYAACDIVCNPSVWNDPAPLANIEGLAAGKPVVSTFSGGIPEYVNNSCGVLVERGSGMVNELTRAIVDLASDSCLRQRLSDGARKAAVSLDVRSYYDRFCKIVSAV